MMSMSRITRRVAVSKYIHFTHAQKSRANSVEIASFLALHGEEVFRGGHELRWRRHDSVTLGGNRWYQHSAEMGGGPLAFLKRFSPELFGRELSYPEIMEVLLNERILDWQQAEPKPERKSKSFELPTAHKNMRRVYAYLVKQRGIDAVVITHFAKAGTLYEDEKYHNAVFVGRDENGIARHAHKRSTYSEGKSFRANVSGSDSRFGFSHIGRSDRIYVFEAPIDLLSFISMHKEDWQQHSYISLSGVADHALMHALKTYPHLRAPVLCLDNDKAGLEADERITKGLHEAGYEEVSCLLPINKDFNEDLLNDRKMLLEQENDSRDLESERECCMMVM